MTIISPSPITLKNPAWMWFRLAILFFGIAALILLGLWLFLFRNSPPPSPTDNFITSSLHRFTEAKGIVLLVTAPPGILLLIGLTTLCLIRGLFPSTNCLKLTPDGIEITGLFRTQSFPWSSIDRFVVGRCIAGKTDALRCGFKFDSAYAGEKPKNSQTLALEHGFDVRLPHNYGMTPETLATHLNQYRTQASGRP